MQLTMPDTRYFGAHRTRMAAQAYIQGVRMVFEANGQLDRMPALVVREEEDRHPTEGKTTWYQVVVNDAGR